MSLFSKSFKAFLMVVATALLPMLASCQLITEDYDDEISDNSASRYINITVSVSASNEPVTRANPTGGETGDGLEKGLDRENAVDNITLIFYKDDAGINTIDANTKVAFFATYPVTKNDNYNGTHNHNLDDENVGWTGDDNHQESNDNEVIYSTGDQKLDENAINVTKTYHAIVVANAPSALLSAITVNETSIAQVRDMVVSTVYNGTGVGTDAQKFVMSSERDATVTFTNKKIDEQKNTITYYFECIHIERLAARIDFWAKTKDPDEPTPTYIPAEYNANTYDHEGYIYNVGPKDTEEKQDHFVLTSITPFNVMNGNEYLLKRTNNQTNPYLAKETTSNWVLDPYTALKNAAAHPDYLVSTLTSVKDNMANDYNIVLSTRQTASTETTEGTKFSIEENGVTADNIIIGYPKENTLTANATPLYYYATGLAFEGYYYSKNATKDTNGKYTGGERKVFYHYLRHQGDQDAAYSALTDETLDTDTKCPASPAMNFGIVRNNIYRVCIESITPVDDDIKVTLLIKVKKWDKFVHEPIYM